MIKYKRSNNLVLKYQVARIKKFEFVAKTGMLYPLGIINIG